MGDPKRNGNNKLHPTPVEMPAALEEAGEPDAPEGKPAFGWREIIRQAFAKARQSQQPVSARRELSKDKAKAMLVLGGAAVLMLLFFLGIFSSPQKAKKPEAGRRPGAPDLGRRTTPGQENAQAGSATPLLNAQVSGEQGLNKSDVTPADIDRTARAGLAHNLPPAPEPTPKRNADQYALGRVDFDSALAKTPGYGVGPAYQHPQAPPPRTESIEADLRKPSLVFVRAAEVSVAGGAVTRPAALEQSQFVAPLPPGTRLVARLESAVSTAVKEPVVAVVEYNYERDGEIVVPAGAKAIGQLRQANRSGYVDIRFDRLEMPDGTTQKIGGVAMGLDFQPLKGAVSGKATGTKFLVRTFTGLGTVAAYLVGNGGSGGFYGPVSESALLRERVANNIGIAGDQQLNDLAFNQNIVVTVPGNARFYIVLETGALEGGAGSRQPAAPTSAGSREATSPSLDELRQLIQLRQELSAMYQQGNATPPATETPQ
jgi:hypothetical protein